MPKCQYCGETPYATLCPNFKAHVASCKKAHENGLQKADVARKNLQAQIDKGLLEIEKLNSANNGVQNSTELFDTILHKFNEARQLDEELARIMRDSISRMEAVYDHGFENINENMDRGVNELLEGQKNLAMMMWEMHKNPGANLILDTSERKIKFLTAHKINLQYSPLVDKVYKLDVNSSNSELLEFIDEVLDTKYDGVGFEQIIDNGDIDARQAIFYIFDILRNRFIDYHDIIKVINYHTSRWVSE